MNGKTDSNNPSPERPAAEADSILSGGHRRKRNLSLGAALGIGIVLLVAGIGVGVLVQQDVLNPGNVGQSGVTTQTITETGSTLLGPLFEIWGPNYTKLNPNVQVAPDLTGSGAGISQAEAGTVDIGATDAYLTPATAAQYHLINVPVAISAQLAMYNLPGLNNVHLNLNGTVLAKIYSGVITNWNDPEIQAANPGVSLPNNPIVVVHRSDGSGDTFMWTSMMYLSWSGWNYSYGTSVKWLSTSLGYNGNGGVVTGLSKQSYTIGYVGISWLNQAEAYGLGYAALGDQAANVDGTNPANYILPSSANISQDASLGLQNLQPPSVAVSLILGGVAGATNLHTPGQGGTMPTAQYPTPYPDVNLEYTLISTQPKDAVHQKYVVQFLEWALAHGNNAVYLNQVYFLPLTPAIIGYDMQALATVPISG